MLDQFEQIHTIRSNIVTIPVEADNLPEGERKTALNHRQLHVWANESTWRLAKAAKAKESRQ